jgi:hypothetical protein
MQNSNVQFPRIGLFIFIFISCGFYLGSGLTEPGLTGFPEMEGSFLVFLILGSGQAQGHHPQG